MQIQESKPGYKIPRLENGDRLDQPTFHERYEAMPPGVKAELIGGTVYIMASPVGSPHSRHHALTVSWLVDYSVCSAALAVHDNPSVVLGLDKEPQPDACLRLLPDYGGSSDEVDDYVHGAPELVVEIASSSASYDLHAKLKDYEQAGVREYVVVEIRSRVVHWFQLVDGRFERIGAESNGLFESRHFPGLRLDGEAMLALDASGVKAALHRGMGSVEHKRWIAGLTRSG